MPKLSAILPSYHNLRLAIFIADVFHTTAEESSIIFNLRRQLFVYVKNFELERLKWFKILNLAIGTLNEVYFHSFHESFYSKKAKNQTFAVSFSFVQMWKYMSYVETLSC